MPIGDHESAVYRIRVRGRLDENWSTWFEDMAITVERSDDHTTVTTLTGPVTDQAALHGILSRIRDLGLPLLSVQCLEENLILKEER
jgi:hypothetical protein